MLLSMRNAALGLQGPEPAEGDREQAELGQKRNGAEALQTMRAESCGHADSEPDWPRRGAWARAEGRPALDSPFKKTCVNSSHLPREHSVNSLDKK